MRLLLSLHQWLLLMSFQHIDWLDVADEALQPKCSRSEQEQKDA
jgi:hypothetical protein